MEKEKLDLRHLGDRRFGLDVKGFSCPYPVIFARRAMEELDSGDILELTIDNKPSCERVPAAMKKDGHQVLKVSQLEKAVWELRIKKK